MKELEKLAIKIPVKLPPVEEMPIYMQQLVFGEVIYHVSEEGVKFIDPRKVTYLDDNTIQYER